jgi:hypothetical protein
MNKRSGFGLRGNSYVGNCIGGKADNWEQHYEILSKLPRNARRYLSRMANGVCTAMDFRRGRPAPADGWDDAGRELCVPQRHLYTGDDHAGGAELRLHADRPREEDLCPRRDWHARSTL